MLIHTPQLITNTVNYTYHPCEHNGQASQVASSLPLYGWFGMENMARLKAQHMSSSLTLNNCDASALALKLLKSYRASEQLCDQLCSLTHSSFYVHLLVCIPLFAVWCARSSFKSKPVFEQHYHPPLAIVFSYCCACIMAVSCRYCSV